MDYNSQEPYINLTSGPFQADTDILVKSLKKLSRRLRAAFSTYGDELEVLDRLYYKNRNQHSAALFWKRVGEMRRYCTRLNNMNLCSNVEEVRVSLLRSQPAAPPQNRAMMASAHRNLAVAITFAEKTNARLLTAGRSFHIAMQAGAFLQLILTISAISSRLMAITTEIASIVRLIAPVFKQILSTLNHAPEPELAPGLLNVEREPDGRKSPRPDMNNDESTLRDHSPTNPCLPQSPKTITPATLVPISQVITLRRSKGGTKPTPSPATQAVKKRRKMDEIDRIFSCA